MLREVRRAVFFTAVTMALFGGAYHAALWGVANLAFPAQAQGSLLRHSDGTVIGSRLIAQEFTRPEYFHPRPSSAGYRAASGGGSNFGPFNPEHLAEVKKRLSAVEERDGVPASRVPSEMVTASGAGLDPHIAPSAASIQARRVAAARGVAVEQILDLVRAHTEPPSLGFVGRARVNVLELNLALDTSVSGASVERR